MAKKSTISQASLIAGLRAAFGDTLMVKAIEQKAKVEATTKAKRKIDPASIVQRAWDDFPAGTRMTGMVVMFRRQHCLCCGADHEFVGGQLIEITGPAHHPFRHLIAATTANLPPNFDQLPKKWEWDQTPTHVPVCPTCAHLADSVDDLLVALETTTSPRQALMFAGIES